MMKWLVAVSGGVDSVVLLDMLAADPAYAGKLVVAHFDHGIRPDSADDARFVQTLAERYGVPFEHAREELGPNASEETARDRRYAFLRGAAQRHGAKIVTAHHADDVAETVAINITRGTGWRGLAVLHSPDIERPLLGMSKGELHDYAKSKGLNWRDDPTNADTKYLRNDIRRRMQRGDELTREALLLYRDRQIVLKGLIDQEAARFVAGDEHGRYFYIAVPENVGAEVLRALFVAKTGSSPTIPQRRRALHAIKTMGSGKRFEVADGIALRFTKSTFIVEARSRVLS